MQEYDILKAPLPELQRAEQAEMRKIAEVSAAKFGKSPAEDSLKHIAELKAKLKELENANPR